MAVLFCDDNSQQICLQLYHSESKYFLGHTLLHTANSYEKPWAVDSSWTYVSHCRENYLNYFQIEQGSNIHSTTLPLLCIPVFLYPHFFKKYSFFFEQK